MNESSLSYQELEERSNQLAHYLQAKGIGKEEMVGLFLDRSVEMIVGLLGILKAGAAYVPIDPGFPNDRIEFLLNDASIEWVLSTSKYESGLEEKGCTVIALDKEHSEIASELKEALSIIVNPEDLMYVIYTSGSTGRPKGVMLEHRSLANLSAAQIKEFEVSAADRILQFTTLTFDVSVSEILMGLLSGATLVLVEKEVINGGDTLINYMEKHQVSVASLPPAYLKVLDKKKLTFLRCIITAGEAANVEDAQYLSQYLTYYNAYGPTECAVYSTAYKVDGEKTYANQIPIGKPLNGLKAYVVDKKDKLCPIGVAGELLISGVGVARGYLNRPELTKEKFIRSPFDASDRMYRTGDYVKWNKDGQLEFIGRRDDQVKIRGFRIELGEIESTLDKCDLVKQASVQVIKKGNDKNIAAYIVPNGDYDLPGIQMYLESKLPDYMKPAYFMELEKIPLTSHGKIDRKALPDPDMVERVYTAPATATETTLVAIWSAVLQLDEERISATDSFFALGGNSLKAILLINKISKSFSVAPTLRSVFQYQDIQSFGTYVDGLDKITFVEIPKAATSDYYPLSSSQQRMYFLYELNKEGTSYNMPMMFRIEGDLNLEQLELAFTGLVARHQSLRTLYDLKDGQSSQSLVDANAFSLDYSRASESELDLKMETFVRPFDLSKELPFRVSLVETTDGFTLMIDMHHIAGDGVSMEILMRDFWLLYNGESLNKLEVEYVDYAVWQQSESYQTLVAEHKTYWTDVYAEEVNALDLPTDHVRPSTLTNEGYEYSLALSEDQSKALRDLALGQGVTMYTLLLGVYKVFLQKLTNENDIVVGTPTAGRHHVDMEGIVGMFVNTLVLRDDVNPALSFNEFLAQVQDRTISAFDHQLYQYEDLVEALEVPRNINRNPLFDVFYAYNKEVEGLDRSGSGMEISPYKMDQVVSKFDLSLNVIEKEKVNIVMTGRKDLFEQSTITRFVEYLVRIIDQVLSESNQNIEAISLLSKTEEDLLLSLNEESENIDKSIVELFSEQVEKTPDNQALVFEDKILTYRELDEQSNQVARYLQGKGIEKEEMVGLFLDRSVDMIVGLLGILKIGAAYVPIDPGFPDDRIAFLLEDASIQWVLSTSKYESSLEEKGCAVIALDTEHSEISLQSKEAPEVAVSPENLMYVIYTSGSTGRPKGVMLEHRSLANLSAAQIKEFEVTAADRILQFTTLTFDVSVSEILMALLSGAALILVEKEVINGGESLIHYMKKQEVSIASLPPAYLKVLDKKQMKFLRCVITAGESANVEDAEYLCEHLTYYNAYGPTECAVYSTTYKVDARQNYTGQIPIGKALENLKAYVLDANDQLCPMGIIGELCIGGAGVARGYLNRPDLTKEKFVANPFDASEKMYKTGDYAKWNKDGQLEFIGRRDAQVKIRGFRIELGEIESTLDKCDLVKQVSVQVSTKGNDKNIIAYIVPEGDYDLEGIQMYLEKKLPGYMKPAYFMELENIPLTSHGKIDRKSLPDPDQIERPYTAPSTITEEALVSIWSEILRLDADKISVNANFFSLGGHSLVLVKMMHLIREEFNTEISIDRIYRYPTVAEIAKMIDSRKVIQERIRNQAILLKEQDKAEGNAFFIHDGSGDIYGYMEMVQSIEKYNCYGLAFEDLDTAVEDLDMETLSSIYLKRIREIQADGPYRIIGWSAGGVLTYEIARILESQGELVEKVVLIDTHFNFDVASELNEISLQSELELINSWTNNEVKLDTAELKSVADLWDAFFDSPGFNLLSTDELKSLLPPNTREMIAWMDRMTTRELLTAFNKIRYVTNIVNSYRLSSSIGAKANYIKASQSNPSIKELPEYFTDFNTTEVKGTHFSIMKNDSVEAIVKLIES